MVCYVHFKGILASGRAWPSRLGSRCCEHLPKLIGFGDAKFTAISNLGTGIVSTLLLTYINAFRYFGPGPASC